MAFEATKREWGELYAFFRLLADGYVYSGTPDVRKNEALRLPVAMVQREEHDGTRQYILEKDTVHLKGENIDKRIPREDFATVAELIYAAIRQSREDDVTSPDGVEEFLDEVAIFDLEAKTDDRTDFSVAFYSVDAPLTGFCVRSRLGMMIPLLDGGRTANFKFEQTGVKFATPTVNKINAEGEEDDVISRMLMIERLGGTLKYSDVADKIFRSNLSMIDLHMGRLMAEMTRLMWLDGITKVSELTEEIKKLNPLKIKDELITKHGFYEYKVKELLLALAMGLRPAKLYNGTDSAIAGFLFVTGDGEVLCYQRAFRQTFADFLFQNSRLLKGSILDNVRLGRAQATEAEVLAALKAAQCMDIVEKFPAGIHTVIGTKGVYLSGGEQQRIAIARAMLKNAPILILDEATAFADPDNEAKVQAAFAQLAKGKTVLMIAHRLSTVANADCIYVVQDGQIVESGTKDELCAQNGLFARMWQDYQASVQWKVAKEG